MFFFVAWVAYSMFIAYTIFKMFNNCFKTFRIRITHWAKKYDINKFNNKFPFQYTFYTYTLARF
jgi:hypothetical protein